MKELKNILAVMILFLFLFCLFANGQQVLTETFVNRNFPKPAPGNGSFTGLSGTVWNYTSIRTYTGYGAPNPGDTNYATFYSGGSLSASFNKKISKIAFKANDDNATDIAIFEVFINNESKGTLSFTPAETKSLNVSAPCKNNVVKIQFISGRAMMDDLAITFDTVSPDTGCVEISTRVYNIHSSFGNDPKTQMNISWSTPVTDTSTYVLYGTTSLLGSKTSNQFERVILHDTLDTILMMHHVTLTGLTPGTRYLYRCGGDAGLSGICTFRTAPAGTQPFTYAVLADVQEFAVFNAAFNNCAKFMKEQDVSFVLQVGDLVQEGSYLNQWNKLFESGKPIFEVAPFMAVFDGHDGNPYNKRYYQDIFKYPSNKSTQYKNMWYSFEYSNAVYSAMWCTNSAIQKTWMDSVFKNTTKPWKFSYWHYNPYSTGGHGGDGIAGLLSTFLAVTDTYNIATVYNGHSHAYEFTHPILKVGNPPVVSNATVNWSTRRASASLSQGTIFYNGAGIGGSIPMNTYYASGLPQNFTLTGDSVGGDYTLLLATVYSDSVVYKVVFYQDCKTYKKGDVLFKYTIINDTPGTKYSLTVNGGSGGGNYAAGTSVVITATAPATGKVFDKWTGDISGVANVNSSATTITMPAAAVSITATYKDAPPNTYTLTVTGGTGSGNYSASTVVNIVANSPAAGKAFDKWTGNVDAVADVSNSTTTITMPAANTSITAAYRDVIPADTFVLIVVNGTGSGNYAAGTVVSIKANKPAEGKVFDVWAGNVAGIADVNDSATTITMPAANTGIAAYYRDETSGLNTNDRLLSVYPNPARDYVIVNSAEIIKGRFTIINSSGVTVMENIILAEEFRIDVSRLPKGLYVIRIISENESVVKTILLQ